MRRQTNKNKSGSDSIENTEVATKSVSSASAYARKEDSQDAIQHSVGANNSSSAQPKKNLNSAYENRRDVQIKKALGDIKKSDENKESLSRKTFESKDELLEAINESILPQVFSIRRKSGQIGTGFLHHSAWLVSNAHVLPDASSLEGAEIKNKYFYCSDGIKKSFHRLDTLRTPDVAIVNFKSDFGNGKGLSTEFSENDGLEETFFFYIYLNHGNLEAEFREVSHYSEKNTFPLAFKAKNDIIPEYGCSGSPIIEARIVFDTKQKWEFRVAGVLYGRVKTEDDNKSMSMWKIYAIPTEQDFRQIKKILINENFAENATAKASASAAIGHMTKVQMFSRQAKTFNSSAKKGFESFAKGETELELEIDEANDIEKLFYSGQVKIEKSLLLENNATEHKALGIENSVGKDIDRLKYQFEGFLIYIGKQKNISLQKGDEFFKTKYFRIDVTGGNKIPWLLQLQDNTGENAKIALSGKSPSSVFASVRIPITTLSPISGERLSALLRESYDCGRHVEYLEQAIGATQAAVTGKKKKDFKIT